MAAHATRNGGPSSGPVTIPKSLPPERDRNSSQRVRSPAVLPPAPRSADPLPEFIAPQLALLAHNPHPLLRYSEHFTGSGEQMFQRACREHLEGIICKDSRRPYVSSRSTDWLKVKCKNRQEFVIIGYTSPKGSRAHLGALLLAAHEADGRLRYAGRVGTGMGAQTLRELQQRLAVLHTTAPPVSGVRGGRDVTWVEPRLVAEIEFSEFTAEKILRHPAFVGLRADKPAAQVVLETPAPPPSPAPRQLAAGRAALPRHRPPARR